MFLFPVVIKNEYKYNIHDQFLFFNSNLLNIFYFIVSFSIIEWLQTQQQVFNFFLSSNDLTHNVLSAILLVSKCTAECEIHHLGL